MIIDTNSHLWSTAL